MLHFYFRLDFGDFMLKYISYFIFNYYAWFVFFIDLLRTEKCCLYQNGTDKANETLLLSLLIWLTIISIIPFLSVFLYLLQVYYSS